MGHFRNSVNSRAECRTCEGLSAADTANLTEFSIRPMLALRSEEETYMSDRGKRFAFAILLTALDLIVLDKYFGSIWHASFEDPWFRAGFLSLLILWAASAIVLWIHVYYDLRRTLRERTFVRLLGEVPTPGGLEGDSDV